MLVVCVVAVYFIVGFYGKSLDSYRINQRAVEVRREIDRIEAQNRDIQARIAYLQSDGYVETAAGEKLNLARPGDRSVVLLQDTPGRPDRPGRPGELPRGDVVAYGHLGEWLDLFFGPAEERGEGRVAGRRATDPLAGVARALDGCRGTRARGGAGGGRLRGRRLGLPAARSAPPGRAPPARADRRPPRPRLARTGPAPLDQRTGWRPWPGRSGCPSAPRG